MRIGILTGGGDCPGLNPAMRGFVLRAMDYGYDCIGFQNGWRGLVEGIHRPLRLGDVEDIILQGGTILGSTRTNPFASVSTPPPARLSPPVSAAQPIATTMSSASALPATPSFE